MVAEKKMLSFEDIESQTALELPDRETLVPVTIVCLALCNVGPIRVNISNNDVAALQQICIAAVGLNLFRCEFKNEQ
jgi:hypothetical protein